MKSGLITINGSVFAKGDLAGRIVTNGRYESMSSVIGQWKNDNGSERTHIFEIERSRKNIRSMMERDPLDQKDNDEGSIRMILLLRYPVDDRDISLLKERSGQVPVRMMSLP